MSKHYIIENEYEIDICLLCDFMPYHTVCSNCYRIPHDVICIYCGEVINCLVEELEQ